jgi:Na+/glutamate symporter
MTNASSTYLGVIIGAILGGIISWWIYNRQQKTADKQDDLLSHIKDWKRIMN